MPTALSKIAVEVGVPIKPAPIVATESEISALSKPGISPPLPMNPARKESPISVDMLSKRSTIVMEKSTPTMPTVIMVLKSTWKIVSVGKILKSAENILETPSVGVTPKATPNTATARIAISIPRRTPLLIRTPAMITPRMVR